MSDEFENVPQWIRDLAAKIHSLVDRPGMMTWFRDKLRKWIETTTGPVVLFPIPDRLLSLLEKYAILSAIHDEGWKGEKILSCAGPMPWAANEANRLDAMGDEEGADQLRDDAFVTSSVEKIEQAPYETLLYTVRDVPENDVPNIEAILADVQRNVCEDAGTESTGGESAETVKTTKAKRSTQPGEAQAKPISALTKHHKYADDSALNLETVGSNELARLAGVSKAASDFFTKQFGGYEKYKTRCADQTTLVTALKLLNQEFAPHQLYGGKPPGEGEDEE